MTLNEILIGIINIDNSPRGYNVSKMLQEKLKIPKDFIKVFNFKRPEINTSCNKITSLNLNHQNIARYAYKNGFKYSMILEDDAELNSNTEKCRHLFYYLLSQIDKFDWEIVFLGSSPKLPLFRHTKHIYRTYFTQCCHAYLLSKDGMKKIIHHKFPNYGEDSTCFGFGSLNIIDWKLVPYMKNYTLYPPIMHQNRCPGFLVKILGNCNHELYQDINYNICIFIWYLIPIVILYFYSNKLNRKLLK